MLFSWLKGQRNFIWSFRNSFFQVFLTILESVAKKLMSILPILWQNTETTLHPRFDWKFWMKLYGGLCSLQHLPSYIKVRYQFVITTKSENWIMSIFGTHPIRIGYVLKLLRHFHEKKIPDTWYALNPQLSSVNQLLRQRFVLSCTKIFFCSYTF